MKIKNLLLIVLCLLISGCSFSTKEPINISFSDVTSIFAQNMWDFYLRNNSFFNTKGTDFHLFCGSEWWNSNLKLYFSSDLSWYETYLYDSDTEFENNYSKEMLFDLYFQDDKKKSGKTFQWSIFSKKIDNDYFIKLSDWVIDLGTWNYETDFANLLVQNLWEKWIKYDPNFSKKINELFDKYIEVLQYLRYGNLFEQDESMTYEGDTAFLVHTSDIFKPDFDLKWVLIVKSPENIELKFDELIVKYDNKSYYIWWNIWNTYWNISIKDDKNSTKSIDISRQRKKSKLQINITQNENFKELLNLKLEIKDFWQNWWSELNYKIDWDLQISPVLIYWSNLENETKIDIICSYEKSTLSWNLSVSEPDSYLLLDQILWDEYSLKSILWK